MRSNKLESSGEEIEFVYPTQEGSSHVLRVIIPACVLDYHNDVYLSTIHSDSLQSG